MIEGLRVDSLWWGPFRVSQVLAAVSCLAAVVVLIILAVRKYSPKLYVQQVAEAAEAKAAEAVEEASNEEAPAKETAAEVPAEEAAAEETSVEETPAEEEIAEAAAEEEPEKTEEA